MITTERGPAVIRRVADVLPEAHRHANWDSVRELYRQLVRIAGRGSERVPAELTEAFAHALRQASSSSAYVGRTEQSCVHALAILAEVEGHEVLDLERYRTVYEDDRLTGPHDSNAPLSRRRPSPFESFVETSRRVRDARRVREVLRATDTSAVPTGSTSYGCFYNVRGNRHGEAASDLDIVMAIGEADSLEAIADRLRMLPGVSMPDVDRFVRRCRVFAGELDDEWTVFSHKIALWTDGTADPVLPAAVAPVDYLLSLHFMTPPVLEHILVGSTPRLLRETAGTRRTVRDYREAPTQRRDHVRTFTGRSYFLDLETGPTQGGFLRSTRVYYIDESDHYCPGFFQTMFLPRPEPLWDDLDVRPALDEFHRKLSERVRYEAEKHPHAMIRPSFAHPRRAVFTPWVIRELDDAYWRA